MKKKHEKTYEKKLWEKTIDGKNNRGKICQNPNRGNISVKILTVGTYLSNTGHLTPYQPYPDPSVIKSTPTANNPKSIEEPSSPIWHPQGRPQDPSASHDQW